MSVVDGSSIKDLEKQKFRDNADSDTVVATTSENAFFLSIANGEYANIESVTVTGDAPSFNSNQSPIDVTSFVTPSLYTFIATAGTLDLVSNNAADAAAGTGAQNVLITGLIAGYIEDTETIAMNGVTPVTSLKSWLRVNDVRATDVGTGGENAGIITATHSVAGIVATIRIGNGNALQAIYTIPAGKTGFLGAWGISTHTHSGGAVTTKEIISKLKTREPNKSWQVIKIGGERSDGGHLGEEGLTFDVIPEKSDIRVEVEALSNNSAVGVSFELIVVTP